MRKVLRTVVYLLGSVSLFQIVVGIIDWSGRWGWLKNFTLNHSAVGWFFHTPFVYLAILIGIGMSVWIERHLREPNLLGRYVNFRAIPDLHSATMQMAFDAQNQTPGWDLARCDWDFFFDIQMVNDSDTRTTLDHFESEIATGRLRNKKVFQCKRLDDLDSFDLDMCLDDQGHGNNQKLRGERYRDVPSLVDGLKDGPLDQASGTVDAALQSISSQSS